MGTIADLLGAALPEGWNDSALPDSSETDTADGSQPTGAGEDPIHNAVFEAIREESGLPELDFSVQDQLESDLELTGLALWSVVSVIERSLKIRFVDADVQGWTTVADIIDAARTSSPVSGA